jgi:hypothetical protein
LLVLFTAALASAAEPTDLYRRVNPDVGVCVELVDLARVWPQVRDSGWFAKLRESPAARQWTGSDDFQKLLKTKRDIEAALQQPLIELANDLFGRQTLLAITPGDAAPQVLLITRARSAEALDAALTRWDRLDPAESSKRSIDGQTYFVRVPRKAGQPVAYAIQQDVLLLSSTEATLKEALVRTDGLLSDPQFQAGYKTLRDENAVRLFARLRAWDKPFAVDSSLESADHGRRLAAQVWKACHTVTVGLEPRDGIVVDAHVHYDPNASPAWQQFVAEARGPVKIFERVPADALAAFGGRFRWTWFDMAIRHLSPPEKIADWDKALQAAQGLFLGHDPVQTVAPSFGPESGAYVVPGGSAAPEWAPLDAIVAFNVQPSGVESEPTLSHGLHNALRTGLNVWAAVRNAQGEEYHAVVKTREPDELGITWLQGLAAWQPGFASTAAHLVLGSSPEAIEQYLRIDADHSLAADTRFRQWVERDCPQAGQILTVNVTGVRDWLRLHGPKLARHLKSNVTPEKVEQRLNRLDELLQPVDRVSLATQFEPDQARILFTLTVP